MLTELWRQLASKFGDIKFCEIRADMCIEGYPERNTPTILVYKDTEIRRQLVTLRELKGVRTKLEGDHALLIHFHLGVFRLTLWIDLEQLLIEIGALKESDVRLKKHADEDDYTSKNDDLNVEDYDDDWD